MHESVMHSNSNSVPYISPDCRVEFSNRSVLFCG